MKITLNELRGLVKEMLSDEMEMPSKEPMMNVKGATPMMNVKGQSKKYTNNYMFFSNLKQMKRQIELLMELDELEIEGILENGHDWAEDHIAVAKNNLDQVFDFMMNETDCGCDEEEDEM